MPKKKMENKTGTGAEAGLGRRKIGSDILSQCVKIFEYLFLPIPGGFSSLLLIGTHSAWAHKS